MARHTSSAKNSKIRADHFPRLPVSAACRHHLRVASLASVSARRKKTEIAHRERERA